MKLLFVYDYPQSGTESVLKAMAKALASQGHSVYSQPVGAKAHLLPKDLDYTLQDYDVVHFWNKRSYDPFEGKLRIPYGFTAHGFGGTGQTQAANQSHYIQYFASKNPYWMHTMDGFTLQTLGREGLFSFWTPQCITQEGFDRLPRPAAMSLGCIGHDGDGYKRHATVKAAAELASVPCVELNSSDGEVDKAGVIALYEKMAVYVNAAFGACGPVPPQEALLCGRPIITTRLDTMVAVTQEGVNGEFFDGSSVDLARKAKKVFSNYDHYYRGTLETKLLSADEAATRFIEGIEDNL